MLSINSREPFNSIFMKEIWNSTVYKKVSSDCDKDIVCNKSEKKPGPKECKEYSWPYTGTDLEADNGASCAHRTCSSHLSHLLIFRADQMISRNRAHRTMF